LFGAGKTNAQIAEQLVLSEATVKTHIKRLMSKLRLASRAQAVVVDALQRGLPSTAAAHRVFFWFRQEE
jgi:DNA-binding NarL/FixJ family response regulator